MIEDKEQNKERMKKIRKAKRWNLFVELFCVALVFGLIYALAGN